jgi:hypothetical protein
MTFAVAAILIMIIGGCANPPAPEPLRGPFQRGVNAFTFLWFAGYGKQAGNESVASYQFLAHHGVSLIRLLISWERIQPELGGELAPDEVSRLVTELSNARAAGLDVTVDLHNGCRYQRSDGTTVVCSRGITVEQFVDVWQRLSAVLRDIPNVVAYDLMNEPNQLVGTNSNTRADAEVWEEFSQAAVKALRDARDSHRLMIEGVNWSAVDMFEKLHPKAWINDPLNNVWYSAHQYFDVNGLYKVAGQQAPEVRYTYWARYFEQAGRTGGESFDDWTLHRLQKFIDWLARNHVRGDIGEIGWPAFEQMVAIGMPASEAATESRQWNNLAERWFELADNASLSATYFLASGLQFVSFDGAPPGLPDPNAVFVHRGGNGELRGPDNVPILTPSGALQPRDIDTAYSQYEVLAKHPSRSQ